MEGTDITLIGITNFRNTNQKFGIKDTDRLRHIYCVGKTGVGKSTLLKNMALSDIERGNGVCIIDPHGDLSLEILSKIPAGRLQDVIYFNPSDLAGNITFNPLHAIHPKYHHLVASGLVSTFRKVWTDSWGPRLEYILKYALLTLLWYPRATLLDIQPLLADMRFRNDVLEYVKDEHILIFWKSEFDKYSPKLRNESIAPILNKTGLFISSLPLRNVVGQITSSFRMQRVMDDSKVLIVNLSKGMMGDDASAILGSMLVTSMQLAAMHRASKEEKDRTPFYCYIDEMHSFVTLSISDILSEARKYKLGLFLTHQYLHQLQEPIQKAIFGNVGTLISFQVGSEDAEQLVKEFFPVVSQEDLVNLPKYGMYLKLCIDGASSQPFSAISLPDITSPSMAK